VRLHEEGFHLSGIVLLDNASLTAAQAEEIRHLARSMNWRTDAVDVTCARAENRGQSAIS